MRVNYCYLNMGVTLVYWCFELGAELLNELYIVKYVHCSDIWVNKCPKIFEIYGALTRHVFVARLILWLGISCNSYGSNIERSRYNLHQDLQVQPQFRLGPPHSPVVQVIHFLFQWDPNQSSVIKKPFMYGLWTSHLLPFVWWNLSSAIDSFISEFSSVANVLFVYRKFPFCDFKVTTFFCEKFPDC